jgi:2-oxo-4-hydroxy-4-carboxy-5-ureidoimidazoline decarboxylase
LTLAEINRLDWAGFVARLGAVYEHSPWVAERAWKRRPFRSIEELHAAMQDELARAAPEEQLALVRAHPELAGGENLTVDSTSEQGRLGFNRLSRPELERMAGLNRRYRETFGFPCIVALRLHAGRESVMAEMERRIHRSREEEMRTALEQIDHITRGRLEKLLNG